MQLPESTIEFTVAEVLIGAREQLGLTRAEAARKSGISNQYIEYFEGLNNNIVPTEIFTRHKLRIYSKFLGLNDQKIITAFLQENPVQQSIEKRDSLRWRRHPLKNIPTSQLVVTPRIIKTVGVLTIILGIGIFFLMRAQHILAPPEIILTSPDDGLVTTDTSLTVEGRTEKEVTLLINSKPIYIDTNGNFHDQLDLREGLNTIRVVAIRKHGQETEITRRVVVKPLERPTAALSSPQN